MNIALTEADLREVRAIRQKIHAHPELGYREHKTAQLVEEELARAGVDEIHPAIGGTGIVAVIRRGSSPKSIGIRADMDALPVMEAARHAYSSSQEGIMHACGHDGHTAILLGTARTLVRSGGFNGTVYLVFQPAEEGLGGARRMIEDGLFDRFPMDAIFGLHNWPGLDVGKVGVKAGAIMGAVDRFDIAIEGVGAHAAQPDTGTDPVVVAAQLVSSLQTIVSRFCAPTTFAVVSVTEISAGNAYNVIPDRATLKGTVRTIDPAVRANIETLMGRMVAGIGSALGATCTLNYRHGTPATINHEHETNLLRQAAIDALGRDQVEEIEHSSLAGEDFACLLHERPGAFFRLGNGASADLHNPHYDFCDDALSPGIAVWVQLVRNILPS